MSRVEVKGNGKYSMAFGVDLLPSKRQYSRPFVVGAISMFIITTMWAFVTPRQISSSFLLVLVSTIIGFVGGIVATWVGRKADRKKG